MNVRRLTCSGLEAFASYLDALEAEPHRLVPSELLSEERFSEALDTNVGIEQRVFGSRLAAASYLDGLLAGTGIATVEKDVGVWAWLSLFYFDELCPHHTSKGRNPGERARHIPDAGNFQRYYRHLLAGPYRIYRAHRRQPDSALAVLCQPLDKPGDLVEQFASRQELVTNPAVMAVASRLYVDPATRRPKRGSQTKTAGAARRLADVLFQFDVTWDLYSMGDGELLGVLPDEFERFKLP